MAMRPGNGPVCPQDRVGVYIDAWRGGQRSPPAPRYLWAHPVTAANVTCMVVAAFVAPFLLEATARFVRSTTELPDVRWP